MRSISDIPTEEILTICQDWRLPSVFGDTESVIRTIGELTSAPSHENHNRLILLLEDLGLNVPGLCFDRYTRVLTMKVNIVMARRPALVTHPTTITLGSLLEAVSETERKEISQFNSRVIRLIETYVDDNYDNLMIPLNSLKSKLEQLTKSNEQLAKCNETLRRENADLREDLSNVQTKLNSQAERLGVIEAVLTMVATGKLSEEFYTDGTK